MMSADLSWLCWCFLVFLVFFSKRFGRWKAQPLRLNGRSSTFAALWCPCNQRVERTIWCFHIFIWFHIHWYQMISACPGKHLILSEFNAWSIQVSVPFFYSPYSGKANKTCQPLVQKEIPHTQHLDKKVKNWNQRQPIVPVVVVEWIPRSASTILSCLPYFHVCEYSYLSGGQNGDGYHRTVVLF